MRVATKPLSKEAVKKANSAVAAKYDPVPSPGDSDYGNFRKDWMDAYIDAGGAYEKKSNATSAKKAKKARKKAAKAPKKVSPGQTTQKCSGKPAKAKVPSKSKPKGKQCTCEITCLNVTCEHGRKAKNGLLMVVPDAALDFDNITVEPQFKGGCDGELEIQISGESGFPKKTTAPQRFGAPMPSASLKPTSWIPFMKVSPTIRRVSASACGSTGETVEVWAYPNDKLAFKLDFEDWRKKLKNVISLLPINSSNQRPPVKSLEESGKRKKLEPKKYCGYIAIEGKWQEDQPSHRANCEIDLNGGFDPLFGIAGCFPLYGIPVPGKVAKYVKAGIYLNLGFGLTVALHVKWLYWPDTKDYDYSQTELEVLGKGSVELAAELFLASEDVLSAKAAGKSTGWVKGVGEFKRDPQIYFQAGWNPLTVSVTFKLAWGLFEYEREWNIAQPVQTDPYPVLKK